MRHSVHLIKTGGVAGAERHLLTLLPRLQEAQGWKVSLLVAGDQGAQSFVDWANDLGVRSRRINISGGRFTPRILKSVGAQVNNSQYPALLHTHLPHAVTHAWLARRASLIRGTPWVASVHGTHPHYLTGIRGLIERSALRQADRVIAISNHVKDFLLTNTILDSRDVTVVRYGIETNAQSSDSHPTVRSPEFRIGIASRLVAGKGHATALMAFAKLVHKWGREDVTLEIAGSGPLEHELLERAEQLGIKSKVRFRGYIKDVESFMVGLHLMLFPTEDGFGEGFGLAALEAMSIGVPLICARIDSLPEVGGDSVRYFEPGDADDLVRTIASLLDAPGELEGLRQQGRRRARQEFSADRMVSETLDVYASVMQ